MPLEIPKSAKVYTTAYSDFKGVDYTNDATNVWKKRSPTGLNMSPDLDGKPYKRKGWKIEKNILDFYDAGRFTPKLDVYEVGERNLRPRTATPSGTNRTFTAYEDYVACNVTFTTTSSRHVPLAYLVPFDTVGKRVRIVVNESKSSSRYFTSDVRVEIIKKSGESHYASLNKRTTQTTRYLSIQLGEDERLGEVVAIANSSLNGENCTYNIRVYTEQYELTTNKLYYFELNGYEHIMAFTTKGLYAYREDPSHYSDSDDFVCVSTDADCIASYDRAFFFEGNGTSAFYVYGNGKVWAYEYDAERIATDPETGINNKGFVFSEKAPYVPRVRIGVSANGDIGEPYESVNLFGRFIAEEFQNNLYEQSLNITYSENIMTASVTAEFYKKLPSNGTYRFTYDGTDWKLNGAGINLVDYGITYAGNEVSGDYIEVVSQSNFKCKIALEVAETQNPIVKVSTSAQFDTELEVIKNGTPTDSQVRMDTSDGATTFTFSRAYLPVVSGEDGIRIEYPRFTNIHTQHTTEVTTVTVNAEVI